MRTNINKATELLDFIARTTFRYLDFIGMAIILPILFKVEWNDPKVFISVACIVILSAISNDGVNLFKRIKEFNIQPNLPREENKTTSIEDKDTESISKLSVEKQNWLNDFTYNFSVSCDSGSKKGIEFPNLGGIKAQRISDTEILIFTKDYRSIRISKDEINQVYLALMESESNFFRNGNYNVEIKITKTAEKQPVSN